MPDIFVTNDEARALLRVYCRDHGAIKALADAVDTAPCNISQMLSGYRFVSTAVATKLGLRAVKGFVRIKPDPP